LYVINKQVRSIWQHGFEVSELHSSDYKGVKTDKKNEVRMIPGLENNAGVLLLKT
jgi:hypothetical protein